jgi:hypothetical protein
MLGRGRAGIPGAPQMMRDQLGPQSAEAKHQVMATGHWHLLHQHTAVMA